jgi:sugar (pentulose or hexulose) kinase
MSPASSRPAATAVLDVGRTNVELLAIGPDGAIRSSRQAPNALRTGEPYPHCDTEHLWRWLMAALADLGERFRIEAIVPTSYGASAALVGDAELVLPILDYDAEPPTAIAAAYAEIAPWFEECCCPIGPAGRTLGRQLFWQSRRFPEEFARVRWILPLAQYWAWRLCGVPACEVTSLGAQTQLWDPRQRDFSSLVERQGWRDRLPPLRNAWDVLGPLQFEVADKTGLPVETAVLCGIQDDSANLARYLAAGLEEFALISTGARPIICAPSLPLGRLDPLRDTASGTDLLGRPVACARFVGGQEYAAIAGPEGAAARPTRAEVEALIAAGVMALPSFAPSGGPYPGTGGKGRISGPPPRSPAARAALASLYVALMASVGLDLLESRSQVIVDGSFADEPLFATLLAALRPGQPVAVSTEPNGRAQGAALLVGWAERRTPAKLGLRPVEPAATRGLEAYARDWRAAVDAIGRDPALAVRASARRRAPAPPA